MVRMAVRVVPRGVVRIGGLMAGRTAVPTVVRMGRVRRLRRRPLLL